MIVTKDGVSKEITSEKVLKRLFSEGWNGMEEIQEPQDEQPKRRGRPAKKKD